MHIHILVPAFLFSPSRTLHHRGIMQTGEIPAEAIVKLSQQTLLLRARLVRPRRVHLVVRSGQEGHAVGLVQPHQCLVEIAIIVQQYDVMAVISFVAGGSQGSVAYDEIG